MTIAPVQRTTVTIAACLFLSALFLVGGTANAGQQPIHDGALLRASNDVDVYVVKILNGKQFRRLIVSPTVFSLYGHLRWANVQEVSPATLASFEPSSFLRPEHDATVFQFFPLGDDGKVIAANKVTGPASAAPDPDSVFMVNRAEFALYSRVDQAESSALIIPPSVLPQIPADLLIKQFGGPVILNIPCTCSFGISLRVGPPSPADVIIVPSSAVFPNFSPGVGKFVLGDALPTPIPCLIGAPPFCIPNPPIPAGLPIILMGTS